MISIRWPDDNSLRYINRGLFVCCLLVNSYVLFAPLWPNVPYLIETKITKPVPLTLTQHSSLEAIDRNTNRLIIPKLQLEEQIFDGPDAATLNKGIWRRPMTSTPGSGSNTVLAGHRFTYDGPAVFYRLDKLTVGDQIVVVYDHMIYRYQVRSAQTVAPTEISVENSSPNPQLTLYTCTPMWVFNNRLVFTASLEEKL